MNWYFASIYNVKRQSLVTPSALVPNTDLFCCDMFINALVHPISPSIFHNFICAAEQSYKSVALRLVKGFLTLSKKIKMPYVGTAEHTLLFLNRLVNLPWTYASSFQLERKRVLFFSLVHVLGYLHLYEFYGQNTYIRCIYYLFSHPLSIFTPSLTSK